MPIFHADPVVLLHGVGLWGWCMGHFRRVLQAEGYEVHTLSYPSRSVPLPELAAKWLPAALASRKLCDRARVNFVAHSMGGILLRAYFREVKPELPGRVVMMGPPNGGSEVVDHLHGTPLIRGVVGPNAELLGTDRASFPRQLGPWPAHAGQLGIIAGTRSVNPIFSRWMPGAGDGEVSVASARLEGMGDFIELPVTHTSMLWSRRVAAQAVEFVKNGRFRRT